MKKVLILSAILSFLLILSTMICGLWITANNITDAGSADFHMTCGITSVVFSFITLVLFIALLRRIKKES